MFAHLLRDEGVEVTYQPPEEGRDLGTAAGLVSVYVLVKATDKVTDAMLDAAIKAAKKKWRSTLHRTRQSRFPTRIADQPGQRQKRTLKTRLDSSVTARLARWEGPLAVSCF